jgi:hypothetical protein
MAKKTKGRPVTLDEVFYAYQIPGCVMGDTSVWMRLDEEFVRIVNERDIQPSALAKEIGISWRKFNSLSSRGTSPSWLSADNLLLLDAHGFNIVYILKGRRTKKLTPVEEALLDNFRNASANNQATIHTTGAALTQPEKLNEEAV